MELPGLLERDEYIEQAHFFRMLRERMREHLASQELLMSLKEELLGTTKLPLALDFMASELRHYGVFASAMAKLSHYFTSFQTYVITEAEDDASRFDLNIGLEILEREALYRSEQPTRQGSFLYQFEAVCRNRLRYDRGLEAIAGDPIYDEAWREWILTVRRQLGIVDFSELVYVRSQHYAARVAERGESADLEGKVLFGEKEGKIALANRRKDPLLLFSALQRHLDYPAVPRVKPRDERADLLPKLLRRVERLETRIKLLEEEQRAGAVDLSKFMPPPGSSDTP